MKFKEFLLNESTAYFGERIGDILNALNDLEENGRSTGVRYQVRSSEQIVNQIRQILHSNWSDKEKKYLEKLQMVGVAICRAIDEKDDLSDVLSASRHELEQISAKLGTPVNSLGNEEEK